MMWDNQLVITAGDLGFFYNTGQVPFNLTATETLEELRLPRFVDASYQDSDDFSEGTVHLFRDYVIYKYKFLSRETTRVVRIVVP